MFLTVEAGWLLKSTIARNTALRRSGIFMSNVVIQQAQTADLPALATLEQQVFEDVVYPAFFFRQALDLWPDFLLLAWQDQSLLGYILAAPGQQGPERIGILSLAVSPDAQGMGIGKQLLQTLLEAAPSECRQLWLTVAPDNQPALALYQKFGFFCEKTETDYYGEGEDRLLLVKQCHR